MHKILKTPSEVRSYLTKIPWILSPDQTEITPLSGGVSNNVWLIQSNDRSWVLKQVLPKLKVETDWYANTDRICREHRGMKLLISEMPSGSIPRILHWDPELHLYIMSCAPTGSQNWKDLLMASRYSPNLAKKTGKLLRIIHEIKISNKTDYEYFCNKSSFKELRIDPFYNHLKLFHPKLSIPIDRLTKSLLDEGNCLVHGDFSPKNILISPNGEPIILDFEVIHWGKPAFDIAFMLCHLLLKSIHLNISSNTMKMINAFLSGYKHEIPEQTTAHVGALMLARIDGKSPVPYITEESTKAKVRQIAKQWIGENPHDLCNSIANYLSATRPTLTNQ